MIGILDVISSMDADLTGLNPNPITGESEAPRKYMSISEIVTIIAPAIVVLSFSSTEFLQSELLLIFIFVIGYIGIIFEEIFEFN